MFACRWAYNGGGGLISGWAYKRRFTVYRKALKVKIHNKVALRQVVRKQVRFVGFRIAIKKGNKPKFPCIEI